MLFGLIRSVEPLKEVLDRERDLLVEELIGEALKHNNEVADSVASHPDLLSIENLRAEALTAREEILRSAATEELSLREVLQANYPEAYKNRHWASHYQAYGTLERMLELLAGLVLFAGFATPAAFLMYDWTASWIWTALVSAVAAFLFAGRLFKLVQLIPDEVRLDDRPNYIIASYLLLLCLVSGCGLVYASYRFSSVTGIGRVVAVVYAGSVVFMVVIFVLWHVKAEVQVRVQEGSLRYSPIFGTQTRYEEWRRVLQEVGVLEYLRDTINRTLLTRYSTTLLVKDAPGLRHLGDLKYHVSTSSKDELIRRVSSVDGGSFALAGPRGAGKTILMRALCEGRYGAEPGRDLGVVVSAPVDYQPRDFVLYLYTEVCKATKGYLARFTPTPVRRRFFRQTTADTSPHAILAQLADRKLHQARYLQSFSAELSAKGGIKFAELNAKTATSLAEQPLTYPEIVADLRSFLQTVADTIDGRVLIGVDELDRIGSADRARQFLNDIKAIFWVRGCYFLVSVSEDALRAFELTGHGLRDAFDSAFDEVVVVEHLDFDASTTLLRVRVTGMPLPYHALAYCLSGGLPRELMRSARAIVDQRSPDNEVKIGQVTANLVAEEFARHCRAARLAIADTGADAAKAAELLRRLDEGCLPTDDGLCVFAAEVVNAAQSCSDSIRSLADTVATHTRYLATLAAVFSDQLTEKDIRQATDKATPTEASFATLARARRYLGVNDAFAHMLVEGFRKAWT